MAMAPAACGGWTYRLCGVGRSRLLAADLARCHIRLCGAVAHGVTPQMKLSLAARRAASVYGVQTPSRVNLPISVAIVFSIEVFALLACIRRCTSISVQMVNAHLA